jgi:hypothetical protein
MIVKPLAVYDFDNHPASAVNAPYDPAAHMSMQKVFEGLIEAEPGTFSFVDASKSPDWNGQPPSLGIFFWVARWAAGTAKRSITSTPKSGSATRRWRNASAH